MIIDHRFKKELSDLINKFGIDNELNKADDLLADYMCDSLSALDLIQDQQAKRSAPAVA